MINKLWYIHINECDTLVKVNKYQLQAAAYKYRNIMLNRKDMSQKDIYDMIYLYKVLKYAKLSILVSNTKM